MTDPENTRAVDPARLATGQWCHRAEKTVGEGDIHASYSADRIGMGQPVRKPFTFEGKPWVCTGYGRNRAEAYRLTPPVLFDGQPVSYAERGRNGNEARSDPNGFYHGMKVKHGGQDYVLCGPPLSFTEGQSSFPYSRKACFPAFGSFPWRVERLSFPRSRRLPAHRHAQRKARAKSPEAMQSTLAGASMTV